jgi:4-deoxy-L-threo-5-hexosulose-uronate ketol-isomerase
MNAAFHIVKYYSSLGTTALREAFVRDNLFAPGELRCALTDLDRLVVGACQPHAAMPLPPLDEIHSAYFTERRELGIVNLGESGHVIAGGQRYFLAHLDFLYIGAGTRDISFEPCDGSRPKFYFLSAPAHAALPTKHIAYGDALEERIGETASSSRRTLRKYIAPGLAESCQLVMGLTQLEEGSVWNTMPPHTHSRRSEIYLYFGLEDGAVIHLMGEPHETRHLFLKDYQAVLSPPWSIHCGAGTRPYSFVWGMAGENKDFSDMDLLKPSELR